MPTVRFTGPKTKLHDTPRIADEVGVVHGGRKADVSDDLAEWLVSTGRAEVIPTPTKDVPDLQPPESEPEQPTAYSDGEAAKPAKPRKR